jgi:hypothetical protein
MKKDRRTILFLIAHGRITPAEAERLLIAGNEAREGAWLFAAVIAFALLTQADLGHVLPGLTHIAHALFSGCSLHCTPALVANFVGGLQ